MHSYAGVCSHLGPVCSWHTSITSLKNWQQWQDSADDTAVYRVVTCGLDQQQLQKDTHCLEKWEERWDMMLHPAKYTSLTVTSSRGSLKHECQLLGHALNVFSSGKYLKINSTTIKERVYIRPSSYHCWKWNMPCQSGTCSCKRTPTSWRLFRDMWLDS